MALELTLSCDSNNTESGPTLIHSTGVEHYKIPPEVIRILQESLTNDLLSDHEEGVLCQAGSQRILDLLLQNGFTLKDQTTEDEKSVWTVVQNGGGDSEQPVHPDNSNDENAADAGGEDQGGDDEGEHKEGGEEEEEEEQANE